MTSSRQERTQRRRKMIMTLRWLSGLRCATTSLLHVLLLPLLPLAQPNDMHCRARQMGTAVQQKGLTCARLTMT